MIEHLDVEMRHNIQDLTFKSIIAERLTRFINLSRLLIAAPPKGILSRNFLGAYQIEAVKVEEFLDMHGAKNNKSWYPFRECAAAAKMFSHVLYILIHRSGSAHSSNFREIYEEYYSETLRISEIFRNALNIIAGKLCTLAEVFEINNLNDLNINVLIEDIDQFQLEQNRELKNVDDPEKIVVQLASQFLNYGNSDLISQIQDLETVSDLSSLVPCIISEEKIRSLESKFHSLQSQYDTYISDTNLENLDTSLPPLRSYITLIYQLLDVATNLSHYYERHQKHTSASNEYLTSETSLEILFRYCMKYSKKFIEAARQLCQEMIKAYAEQGEISVAIPQYRGFHVRPSTLVAKIVHHYGSDIGLYLNSNHYDASNPLDLFRANEEINAVKRKMLLEFISSIVSYKQEKCIETDKFSHNLNKLILRLMEEKKIVLYDNEFSSRNITSIEGESFCEFAKRGIAKLLALGSIDIQIEMNAVFRGDKRVLKDIKILADTGYGEDLHGNNIMLPSSLSYLRR